MLTAPHNDEHEIADQDLSRYLVIERTELCKADLGLVFGNRHCYETLAREAAHLYRLKYFSKIMVSGGRKDDLGCVEADAIAFHLRELNVPERDILKERESTNTVENVLFSRKLAEDRFGKHGISSVIGIGSAAAGRRFTMTIAQQWPQVFAMAANANPFPFPVQQWTEFPSASSIIRKEFCKVLEYFKKGDIAEIDIPSINREAVTRRAKLFHSAPPAPTGL